MQSAQNSKMSWTFDKSVPPKLIDPKEDSSMKNLEDVLNGWFLIVKTGKIAVLSRFYGMNLPTTTIALTTYSYISVKKTYS